MRQDAPPRDLMALMKAVEKNGAGVRPEAGPAMGTEVGHQENSGVSRAEEVAGKFL